MKSRKRFITKLVLFLIFAFVTVIIAQGLFKAGDAFSLAVHSSYDAIVDYSDAVVTIRSTPTEKPETISGDKPKPVPAEKPKPSPIPAMGKVAIMKSERTDVRYKPGKGEKIFARAITEGMSFSIVGQQGDWYRVDLSCGTGDCYGWVHSNDIDISEVVRVPVSPRTELAKGPGRAIEKGPASSPGGEKVATSPFIKDLQKSVEELKSKLNAANAERTKDKKVSEGTRKSAMKKANEISLLLCAEAENYKKKGESEASDFCKKSSEHIKLITESSVKDEIEPEDMDKIRESSNGVQKTFGKTIDKVAPSKLSLSQKTYLIQNVLVNFKNSLTNAVSLLNNVKSLLGELMKSAKGKGGFAFAKSLAGGGSKEVKIVKSVMKYLKDFIKNIKTNIKYIQKLVV